MYLFDELKQKLENKRIKIVFPEGHDIRVLSACVDLHKDGYVDPIVVGNREAVTKLISENQFDVKGMTFIDNEHYDDIESLVKLFVERRAGKISEYDARRLLLTNKNYFGTMLVYAGKADGLVSGADNSTGDTIRPGLQIIKMKPSYKRTSGIFFLVKGEERLLMADCGININPTAEDLAETACITDTTARQFGIDPKIALLSFSTKGSAKSEETEKVIKALEIAKEKYPDLCIDGELQFDAAYVPDVAKKKAPNSAVAGKANAFIFPTLDSGNIGYKIAQRLGGYEAVGPVLQGLNKPVNDLSRGCNQQDVYNLALITAVQAMED
ncbi:MAG TPA: phosphate acetyltransferase [Erysipelothrix sp.]|jgi:phosphate acetyltransferase|nr:phosphate acetyltransferase [Erysipelothrix sp.]